MAGPLKPIYTSPRTESQLREILAKLSQNLGSVLIDIGDLENAILRPGIADGTFTARQVVYASSAGHFDLAVATSATLSNAIGILPAAITSGETGNVLVTGSMQSTGWGLTSGAIYYLSPTTPGLITTTAPTTVGQYVVQIGKAISTEILVLNIQKSILL
jgi:hypothetical protein